MPYFFQAKSKDFSHVHVVKEGTQFGIHSEMQHVLTCHTKNGWSN